MQISDSSSRILAGLLQARTGQQLTMSRRWRIETALSALLRERGIGTLDELITILVMNKEPGLSNQVVEALLNNETYFFRDRTPFDTLLETCASGVGGRSARRRSAFASGRPAARLGRKTYSLAMLFADEPEKWQGWTIDILGTDVSGCVVDRARRGTYTQFEVQRGLAITQTIKWFEEGGDGWRITEPLRKNVRFQVQNFLEAPPQPGGFDIILCRNVLLYLCSEKKALAFDRLSSGLAEDGWLMLGAGETVIGQTQKLVSDAKARGLYRLDHRDKGDRRTLQQRRAAARG